MSGESKPLVGDFHKENPQCVIIDNIRLYYVPVVYIVCGVKEDGEIIGHIPHIECSLQRLFPVWHQFDGGY